MDDALIARVAEAIVEARGSTVFYIGAGCSANAGVPTFHGQGAAGSLLHVREDQLMLPTFSHCAVRALMERGLVEWITSSNHDGLISGEGVSEIFGSTFHEICLSCKRRVRRGTVTPAIGRSCEECGGRLKKTGCRYGQTIYRPPLEEAEKHASSKLAVVLGSGMHTCKSRARPCHACY
jgi:NAD-dependent SIR2 family protein deacetylase